MRQLEESAVEGYNRLSTYIQAPENVASRLSGAGLRSPVIEAQAISAGVVVEERFHRPTYKNI